MDPNDLTQLGAKIETPATPNEATIECFNSPGIDVVEFVQNDEFTSLCPVTGQPDFADVYIQYTPNELCIESKSLKLYLQSFRNQRDFAETLAVGIALNLYEACQPYELTVSLRFKSRGGIAIHASHTISMPEDQEVPSDGFSENCEGGGSASPE